MTDLARYINKRKSRDPAFAKDFDSGYKSFKKDSEFSKLLRNIQKDFRTAGYTQKDVDRAVAQVRKSAKPTAAKQYLKRIAKTK